MRNIQNKILICLAIIAFILNGCQFEERYHIADIFPGNDVTNPQAILFLEQLQKQEDAQEDFATALSGYQPMYEEVKITTSSDYGYCYFIPYADHEGVICGSIYYIIDAKEQDGDVIALNDCPLDYLENINAERLNNDIPIYSRYVYSASFAELREKGFKVEPELTAFADLLSNGKTIPLSWEESPFRNSIVSKSSSNTLEIFLEYRVTYIGENYDAVYGLSPTALTRIIQQTLQELCSQNHYYTNITHIPMVGIYVHIPVSDIGSLSPRTFAELFVERVEEHVLHMNFSIKITYTYRIIGGSSSNTGQPGSGGTTGGNNNPNPDNNPDSPPYYRQAEVINCPHAASTGSVLSDLFTGFNAADSGRIGVNNYISFEEYLNDIAQNGDIEHSTSLIRYEHGDDSVSYHLTPTKHGTADGVGNEVGSNSLVATMHNHPNGTPPSAQDLLFTVEQGMDSTKNYQTTFIYVNESTYYTLYIKDKSRLADLYEAICDEIDPETNGFKKQGKCSKFISEHQNTYYRLASEIEQQIYQLAIITARYGNGIFITKYNTNSKTNQIYGVREKGVLSNGSPNYQPIICQ